MVQLTSGKILIGLVNEGASRGTILYGVSSPDNVALDFFSFLNYENMEDKDGKLFEVSCLNKFYKKFAKFK